MPGDTGELRRHAVSSALQFVLRAGHAVAARIERISLLAEALE